MSRDTDSIDLGGASAAQQEDVLARVEKGESLSEACGVDRNFLNLCYAVGSNAYKGRDYVTAYRAFLFLCINEHREADYWTALASVFVAQKQQERALPLLRTAWRLLPSAANSYRFAECCIRCGEKQAAREVLAAALEDIEAAKSTGPLRVRIKAVLKGLSNGAQETTSTIAQKTTEEQRA